MNSKNKKMQRILDREVKEFEKELRKKGVKFSIPVSGKDRNTKIINQGGN